MGTMLLSGGSRFTYAFPVLFSLELIIQGRMAHCHGSGAYILFTFTYNSFEPVRVARVHQDRINLSKL